ncbi:MAG: TolC family protein [Phocaeicola sp.]
MKFIRFVRVNRWFQNFKLKQELSLIMGLLPKIENQGSMQQIACIFETMDPRVKGMAAAFLFLFTLSGCSVYSTFQAPAIETAELVGADIVTSDSLPTLLSWRELFTDIQLQALIDRSLSANSDLLQVQLQIEQSEAILRGAKRAFFPSIALSPEGNLFKIEGESAIKTYSLPLTMQWEIDLFGKLRNQKEQAKAAMWQSRAYVQGVQTQLIASVANAYYTLVMLDEQLRITQGSIQLQKQYLEVMRALKEAGRQTEAAVNQAEADCYSIQVSEEELLKQIRLVENSLTLLLNEPPHSVSRTALSQMESLPLLHLEPIHLVAVANRPDVKQAEYALRGTFYGVNVAQSAFYPSLTLSGSAGWGNGMTLMTMPASLLLSGVASLTQPLFSRGVNQANLAVSKAQYEQSLLAFEKALLVAGTEVNDALTTCQVSANKCSLRQKQVEASQNAYQNSHELMKHTSVTYLEVLIAQSSALQAELLYVSEWLEGVQGQINLYKSLGGGVE